MGSHRRKHTTSRSRDHDERRQRKRRKHRHKRRHRSRSRSTSPSRSSLSGIESHLPDESTQRAMGHAAVDALREMLSMRDVEAMQGELRQVRYKEGIHTSMKRRACSGGFEAAYEHGLHILMSRKMMIWRNVSVRAST